MTDEQDSQLKGKKGINFNIKVWYVTRPHASMVVVTTTQHQDSFKTVVFSGQMVLHV